MLETWGLTGSSYSFKLVATPLISGNFIDFDVNGPEDSCFKYRRVNLSGQKSTTEI